ncbi:MAG: hypothetical protein RIR11_1120 [Bacteroidota bacterium]|jgi:hypothetical protein
MRLLPLFFLFFLLNCQTPPQSNKVILPAFYAWKTNFSPANWEIQTLQQWNAKRVYVKYADLDRTDKKGVHPISTTRLQTDSLPLDIAIIPVFFIVNRVFTKITEKETTELVQYILQQIPQSAHRSIPEIQLDCDWTASTREKYFLFLKLLQEQIAVQEWAKKPILSATIRLHQVKYREKTGIPPVDLGLLMLYNFESPSKASAHNSIIDPKIAKTYLSQTPPYPIPLDAALPLFGWGIHFRGSAFQGFLRDFRTTTAKESVFLSRDGENIFKVIADTSCYDAYFRRGDWIRTEEASPKAIAQVWDLAQIIIPNDTCSLVFFDLNAQNLFFYSHEDLYKRLQIKH